MKPSPSWLYPGLSMWTLLHTYFGIALAILGTAATLDRISAEQFRNDLADWLGKRGKELDRPPLLLLQLYIDKTIGHYFKGTQFSAGNVFQCVKLSFVAMAVLLPATLLVNQRNPFELFLLPGNDAHYLGTFGLFVAIIGWLTVDIVSFLQTAMFMRIARNLKSFWDLAAFALFDIIITLNIFTFIFSAAITLIISKIDYDGAHMAVSLEVSRVAAPITSNRSEKLDKYFDGLRDRVLANGGRTETMFFTSQLLDYARRPTDYLSNFATEAVFKNVSTTEVLEAIQRQGHGGATVSASNEGVVFQASTFSSGGWANLSNWYQFVYTTSHFSQDKFLSIARLTIINVQLRTYFRQYKTQALPLSSLSDGYVYCDGKIELTRLPDTLPSCARLAILPWDEAWEYFIFDLHGQRTDLGELPVSLFASTSLFLTAVFYLGLLLIVVTWATQRVMSNTTFTGRFLDTKKAPFTAMATYFVVATIPVAAIGFGLIAWLV